MSILYITRPMLLKQQSSSSLGRVTDCLEFFYLKPLFFPKVPVPMYIIKCACECASSFVNNPSSLYITPGCICHLFLSLGESHNNMPCNCIDAQRQSRVSAKTLITYSILRSLKILWPHSSFIFLGYSLSLFLYNASISPISNRLSKTFSQRARASLCRKEGRCGQKIFRL